MDTCRTTPRMAKENRTSPAPQTTATPDETINSMNVRMHLSRGKVKKNPSKMGNLGQNPVVTTI
jgi:hypothetical protein